MELKRQAVTQDALGRRLNYQEENGTIISGTIIGIDELKGHSPVYRVEWFDTGEITCWNPLRSSCEIK